MGFDKKKIGILVAAAIVIIASVGGFAYSKKADAKEATAKQALIASIGKQQDLEEVVKQAKMDAPVVSEAYPARVAPKVVASTTPSTSQATPKTESTPISSPTTPTTVKEIPQQSPVALQVATKVVTPAPAQQQAVQAITALTDSNIQHLQGYAPYSSAGGPGAYIDFTTEYSTQKADCDGLVKAFSPITLSDYYKMQAQWLTSPKLVYRSVIGQFCIRGVLTLTAYEDGNTFGLAPNVKYQREVEYRLTNAVKNGKITLSLDSTHYLSEFKAVK